MLISYGLIVFSGWFVSFWVSLTWVWFGCLILVVFLLGCFGMLLWLVVTGLMLFLFVWVDCFALYGVGVDFGLEFFGFCFGLPFALWVALMIVGLIVTWLIDC